MQLKKILAALGFVLACFFLSSCYTFTGASIDGKTIYILPIENRAANIVPSLVPTMSDKIRTRIVSQAGLAPINSTEADYTLTTVVTQYDVSIAGVQGSFNNTSNPVSQNRLTITIAVEFTNKINPKANFKQSFTRFRDYDANALLQNIEPALIGEISTELADDIFNKAFVNW